MSFSRVAKLTPSDDGVDAIGVGAPAEEDAGDEDDNTDEAPVPPLGLVLVVVCDSEMRKWRAS